MLEQTIKKLHVTSLIMQDIFQEDKTKELIVETLNNFLDTLKTQTIDKDGLIKKINVIIILISDLFIQNTKKQSNLQVFINLLGHLKSIKPEQTVFQLDLFFETNNILKQCLNKQNEKNYNLIFYLCDDLIKKIIINWQMGESNFDGAYYEPNSKENLYSITEKIHNINKKENCLLILNYLIKFSEDLYSEEIEEILNNYNVYDKVYKNCSNFLNKIIIGWIKEELEFKNIKYKPLSLEFLDRLIDEVSIINKNDEIIIYLKQTINFFLTINYKDPHEEKKKNRKIMKKSIVNLMKIYFSIVGYKNKMNFLTSVLKKIKAEKTKDLRIRRMFKIFIQNIKNELNNYKNINMKDYENNLVEILNASNTKFTTEESYDFIHDIRRNYPFYENKVITELLKIYQKQEENNKKLMEEILTSFNS